MIVGNRQLIMERCSGVYFDDDGVKRRGCYGDGLADEYSGAKADAGQGA